MVGVFVLNIVFFFRFVGNEMKLMHVYNLVITDQENGRLLVKELLP